MSRHLIDVVADETGIWFLEILVLVSPCTLVFNFVQGIICAKWKKEKAAISTKEKRDSVLLPLAQVSLVMLAK